MRTVLIAAFLVLLLLAAVLLARALPRGSTQAPAAAVGLALDTNAIAQHLAAAIRIPTITDDRPMSQRSAPFDSLHHFLARTYPLVHARLTREVIGGHSLLFHWPGSNSALNPILLMGHMDVVPVAPGSENRWRQPPFSGAIVDGEVWGRGALDDKQHVIAILEAVEALLGSAFQPQRTIYLFFGHDEEGLGTAGARAAAALLEQRKVQLDYVLDEGGVVVQGVIAGVRKPVALVRTAEKGYLSLELSVSGTGGHSSAPTRPTTIGILARALTALEADPFEARLTAPVKELLATTSNDQPLGMRVVLRNLWLFKPLVLSQLAKQPSTDATIRTTIAPTMLSGGPKDNVLPTTARAIVNFRILPGESSEQVIAHVRQSIADERVELRVLSASEPPAASSAQSRAFKTLQQSILQVTPDVLVSPYLLSGATDSRSFARLTDNVFGFSMARGGPELIERAHGSNERIAVRDLAHGVHFYFNLIRNSQN